jgi:hypothetical protein
MRIIGNDPSVPRQTQEIASGTLPNGKPVVVNTDGTVSVVSSTAVSIGTTAVFAASPANLGDDIGAVFDSTNNKVVIAYRDSNQSNYGNAVVGTVSGTSISFGSKVTFANSGYIGDIGIGFDANAGKVLIGYRDNGNSNYGTAIVGTVSGTSISFGTAAVFKSNQCKSIRFAYDSNAQKLVLCYRDDGSSVGAANVCTISGTSVSFGSQATFQNDQVEDVSPVFDSNSNKIVVSYRNEDNSNYGTACVGTVSGTSISFGSATVFEDSYALRISSTFDSSNNKIVTSYRDVNDSDKGKAVVGTVSGTSISFGTPVVFNDAQTDTTGVIFNPDQNKISIAFRDTGNSNKGTAIDGTVSGTSISFDSETVFETGSTDPVGGVVYDTASDKIVIVFRDAGDSNQGKAITYVGSSTNLTSSENFIGFSDGAFADGQSAVINTTNTIDRNQSSLTAGQTLFVQTDGTLGETAGSPSVTAGTAISATEIIVKG